MSRPVRPSTPITEPVFGVRPMPGPTAGAVPISEPVFGLGGNSGA
jgi:hypothetical protein